jgi:SNF2 family DNA or RNA helicase
MVAEIDTKVILFAHYKHTVDLLDKMFHNQCVTIRGGMDRQDVAAIVKSFNSNDNVKILIAQTATAKEGLTLLGTETMPCHTTIFVENTYSIIDRTQAEDRNHRHGQVAEQVSYYDMVGSPIEKKIIRALQDKRDLVKTIMEARSD